MMAPITIRILIVDDSDNLRKVTRRYISSGEGSDYQFEFEEASDGVQAEQVLQECLIMGNPIHIIFLDWMMPKMNGQEFLEKIRSTETFKIRPAIIMLTAETNSEQINACLRHKVAKYIIKPFTQETIVTTVMEVLAGKADGEVKNVI